MQAIVIITLPTHRESVPFNVISHVVDVPEGLTLPELTNGLKDQIHWADVTVLGIC